MQRPTGRLLIIESHTTPKLNGGGRSYPCAYLLVSLQFGGLGGEPPAVLDEDQLNLLTQFRQHRYWNQPQGWKRRLNNVQLLIQPFVFFCSIKPWLVVFEIPGLQRGFMSLIDRINQFPGWLPNATPQRFSSA